MTRRIIHTNNAPKPGGTYSQAVQGEHLVYTAGQVGADPTTGNAISDNVQEQTRQALRNIQVILQAAGCDLDSILKTTCFLTDINDFSAFDEVYREFFPTDPPARSTVQVGLVSPWLVEIEVVAILS